MLICLFISFADMFIHIILLKTESATQVTKISDWIRARKKNVGFIFHLCSNLNYPIKLDICSQVKSPSDTEQGFKKKVLIIDSHFYDSLKNQT